MSRGMSSERRYLIVGPAWVGDMVMAQSLFITLKQKYPQSQIDVLAPEWSLPIIARMPEVNKAIAVPVSHGQFGFVKRYKIGRELRANNYTHAIVLPRSFKSALIPFFAKAKIRTGYRGEMRYGLLNDIRPLDKTILCQTVQRYVALGEDIGALIPPAIPEPVLQVNKSSQQEILKKLGLNLDMPVIGFMPGAEYGLAKCWPIENFAKIAAELNANSKQVWVFGSEKDVAAGEQIAEAGTKTYNLCGKTRLEDVIDLISLTESVVSNDSGLMHIAAATGTKVVAIYGSSTPDYTPPLTNDKVILYRDLDCSPCFKRECLYGHYDCLREITANEVLEVL